MDGAFRNTMIVGVFVYGALALGGLMVAGIAFGLHAVVLLAIVAAAVSYLAQVAGAYGLSRVNAYATWLAIAFGVLAFIILLVRA